jgi:hypothetical protein
VAMVLGLVRIAHARFLWDVIGKISGAVKSVGAGERGFFGLLILGR